MLDCQTFKIIKGRVGKVKSMLNTQSEFLVSERCHGMVEAHKLSAWSWITDNEIKVE